MDADQSLHKGEEPSIRLDQSRSARRKINPLPGFRFDQLSAAEVQHPLIANKYFYILPKPLVESVFAEVPKKHLDDEVVELELASATIREQHRSLVGFAAGKPIHYAHLGEAVPELMSRDDAEFIGLNPVKARQAALEAEAILAEQRAVLKARCGWLMTNRQFLDEHDEQVASRPLVASNEADASNDAGNVSETTDDKIPGPSDHIAFLKRWRLKQLVAPGLPDPPGLLVELPGTSLIPEHLREHTVTLSVPDFHPLPSRDETRHWIDAAYPTQPADHEREWREVTASNQTAKQRMQTWGRHFELQHYWRVVSQRHPNAFDQARGRLGTAFANFFNLSENALRKNLGLLEERLGPGWPSRPIAASDPM